MDTSIAKDVIRAIRTESDRRSALLVNEDPNLAYDQWLFTDKPFTNELCILLLLALRHQLERELLRIAVLATDDGRDLEGNEYRERLRDERNRLRRREGWKELIAKFQLDSFADWESMETLRHLTNCYKHEPSGYPNTDLLGHLRLDQTVKYAPLVESDCFQEGLAVSLGLAKDTDYCAICEEFLQRVDRYLTDVRAKTRVSKVKWGVVSMTDFEC